MTLSDLMMQVEGVRFSSELNLAAGAKAFRRALREHELVCELTERSKFTDARVAVAERINELSAVETDPEYENPFDVALSAYLTVIEAAGTSEAIAKAALSAAQARDCWWTVGLSRELLLNAVAAGSAPVVQDMHPDLKAMIAGSLSASVIRPYLKEAQGQSPVAGEPKQIPYRFGSDREQAPHEPCNLFVMPRPVDEWRPRRRKHRRTATAALRVPDGARPRAYA